MDASEGWAEGTSEEPLSYFQGVFKRGTLPGLTQQTEGPQLHSLFSELVHTVQPTDSNEC